MPCMPDPDYHSILTQVLADIQPEIGRGQVATHIPALGSVDPNQFGMAVADLDGNVTGVGACDVQFSAQSVTKVFALALVIASVRDRDHPPLSPPRVVPWD